ncbi:MAG: septal ring lytic transglycosylase RlpA family protein [Desulfobacteraceae bacterium]|nr:septal ring lytic transglycosylase RlpA family protein [Desulfobacteraceae bacterium]
MTLSPGTGRRFALILAFAAAAGLWLAGCRTAPPPAEKTSKSYQINGQWYHPIPDSRGFRESGYASWYGHPFHGRKTASGETYNMDARTAAHKTLPMGTYVLVKNKRNHKQTMVRINDRGPFVKGRIIDLSRHAARQIDMIGPGTAPVEIAVLEKDHPQRQKASGSHGDYHTGDFTIQIGAFSKKDLAESMRDTLAAADYNPVTVTEVNRADATFYRVRVGRFDSLAKARDTELHLIRAGYHDAFAIAHDGR